MLRILKFIENSNCARRGKVIVDAKAKVAASFFLPTEIGRKKTKKSFGGNISRQQCHFVFFKKTFMPVMKNFLKNKCKLPCMKKHNNVTNKHLLAILFFLWWKKTSVQNVFAWLKLHAKKKTKKQCQTCKKSWMATSQGTRTKRVRGKKVFSFAKWDPNDTVRTNVSYRIHRSNSQKTSFFLQMSWKVKKKGKRPSKFCTVSCN